MDDPFTESDFVKIISWNFKLGNNVMESQFYITVFTK